MYSLLIEAADSYVKYDFAQTLILLQQIDVALLPTQTAKDVYNTMLEASSGGGDRYYAQGTKAFLEKDYISAANYFEAALIYDETNDEAAYYLGLCRQENDTVAVAVAYYEDFLTRFPQSGYVADVTARLAQLRTQLPQEPETSTDNQEGGLNTADDGAAQPDTQAPENNEEQPTTVEETQEQ